MAFERREPYERKLSRTAPRGAETGNSFGLLGKGIIEKLFLQMNR